MENSFGSMNLFRECRDLRIRLWECPPFLFVLLGFATIMSLISTYLISIRYTDDEAVTIVSVTAVAILFLVIGNLIISGFNKIAEANRMKSEFISIISHQLRSPLSIFKWTIDLLDREAQGKPPYQDTLSFLHTLRDTTENMIRLVNSLLEVSRIEARTITLKREPISLVKLTEEITEDFKAYARASNVLLEFTHDPHIPNIAGDSQRLSMVIQNLIDNAIRYSKASGKIQIGIVKSNDGIVFSIKDGGVGIPQIQQKYVFQKFFRAENAARVQTVGSGIGLYTAKAIIDALGGTMGFQSKEGEGSIFWFRLPAPG